MSIEGILVGLLAIGAGAAWAFFGLRFFAILLPIWAFFFGLTAGIDFASNIFADGAIGTVLSWGIGLVFGIVLALISFFWYYAAVTIAVGALGYILGAGLVAALGIDSGFLQFIAGIVVGAVFAVGAFVLAFPAVLVIVVSAASGAIAVVNGALILLGSIKVEDLSDGRLRSHDQLRHRRDDRLGRDRRRGGPVPDPRCRAHGRDHAVTRRITATSTPAAGVPTR